MSCYVSDLQFVENSAYLRKVNLFASELVFDRELVLLCLLYTSDAADDLLCVDLGGRRIIKKNNAHQPVCYYSPTHLHKSSFP